MSFEDGEYAALEVLGFAPGIPNRTTSKLPTITRKTQNQWVMAVQSHKARQHHFDLRLVDPDAGKAHSWAIPKARLPEPGQKLLAVQTFTHTPEYALHFGEGKPATIGKGYGAGTVHLKMKNPIELIESTQNKVRFGLKQEEFLLRRTNKDKWLLMNVTQQQEKEATMTYYTKGRDAALQKLGGVGGALRTLFTGRVPLYHGTSTARAAKILEEGLIPQAAEGATANVLKNVSAGMAEAMQPWQMAERNLAFTTRNPTLAKTYGMQQAGRDRYDRLGTALQRVLGEQGSPLQMNAINLLGILPGGKRALRANVPRSYIHNAEHLSLEARLNPGFIDYRARVQHANPTVKRLLQETTAMPYATDVVLKGGVPAKYFRGSPQYQGVTPSELTQHFREAVSNPRQLGGDVLRSLTGYSHRPGTLIKGP